MLHFDLDFTLCKVDVMLMTVVGMHIFLSSTKTIIIGQKICGLMFAKKKKYANLSASRHINCSNQLI